MNRQMAKKRWYISKICHSKLLIKPVQKLIGPLNSIIGQEEQKPEEKTSPKLREKKLRKTPQSREKLKRSVFQKRLLHNFKIFSKLQNNVA